MPAQPFSSIRPRRAPPGRRPVGHADVAGLAALHHRVQRLQRLVERGGRVVAVQLVEVDVVGLEALQRGVYGVQDVLAAHPLVPGSAPGAAHALGGDDVVVALADQPIADDLLGAPHRGRRRRAQRIDVRGGVEEVDPALGRGVHDGAADILSHRSPKVMVPRQSRETESRRCGRAGCALHGLSTSPWRTREQTPLARRLQARGGAVH